jgi:hypothetical protein
MKAGRKEGRCRKEGRHMKEDIGRKTTKEGKDGR